jgi:hypothetical protein
MLTVSKAIGGIGCIYVGRTLAGTSDRLLGIRHLNGANLLEKLDPYSQTLAMEKINLSDRSRIVDR